LFKATAYSQRFTQQLRTPRRNGEHTNPKRQRGIALEASLAPLISVALIGTLLFVVSEGIARKPR